ncbi:MAG TPA: hypothetical protein VIF60_24065 [Burkholderiaceae bacterium]
MSATTGIIWFLRYEKIVAVARRLAFALQNQMTTESAEQRNKPNDKKLEELLNPLVFIRAKNNDGYIDLVYDQD